MEIISPIPITTDAQVIYNSIPETDHDEYVAGTTYVTDAIVQVTADGVHRVYRSAVDGNVGHYPPDNIYDDTVTPATGYWVDRGPTNAMAMFDGRSRAFSTADNVIAVEIVPGELFTALAVVNIDAANITVMVTDPNVGAIFNKNYSLADNSSVLSFYDWFFSPLERINTFIIQNLPSTSDAVVRVVAANSGDNVIIGEIVLGILANIGKLRYGYSVSIKDYSKKEKDEDGNATVTEGIYSDTATFNLLVDSNKVYAIKKLLAKYRATPLVWIGADWRQDTIIYGYYTDFDVSIDTKQISYCTIEVEELS